MGCPFSGLLLALAANLLFICGPALAQTATWTGATSNDWMDGSNWSTKAVPVLATMVDIGTVAPNATVLGVGSAQSAEARGLSVGFGGIGSLTIQNGSTLTLSAVDPHGAMIGAGANGTVTVDGTGSQLVLSNRTLSVGDTSTGSLKISNSGAVFAFDTVVGYFGTATGTLNIESGGTLTTGGEAFIGNDDGAQGTVTVTGNGSQWTVIGRLKLGGNGAATLQSPMVAR